MKKIIFLLAMAMVTLSAPVRAQTEAEITYQDFYDGLASYGDWVYVDGYGYCWQPGVEEGWRPYTNGSWIYTDAGWTWSSDEEWGWATDHYGRWMLTKEFGWLWIPGYEWAPAWVSWRKSDEYVGWAPLPPEATWQPASGFGPSVDVTFSIGPEYYNFCPIRHLGAPRLRSYIVPPRENLTIINNTVNVTKITNVNNVMIFNEGPDFKEIQRRTEQPVRWARLERRWDVNRDVVRAGEVRNRVEGDVFHVVAPRVERQPTREEKPPKVTTTVRREEFDERIGQERRRVRERTREMDRSAEADVPPPPDGRDKRFEQRREDLTDIPEGQRVTDGQRRRERGSGEFESETRGNEQGRQDQNRGRDRQTREERQVGAEESSQMPPAADQPSREERRRGRTDAQGQSQGREMRQDQDGRDAQRRQQRGEDQSEESLQGSPPGQSAETPTRRSAGERTQPGGSEERRPPQIRGEESGARQGTEGQRKQGRGADQSESPQVAPPVKPPAPDRPNVQSGPERTQRGDGEQNAEQRSRESRGDSEHPNVQRKQAEAPRTPPENVQQRRQGRENVRPEERSGLPAESRESNGQQQQQRGDQRAQGEKSAGPQGQQQKSKGGGQKGDKKSSKGEGEGKNQGDEGQGQDGRGQ
jgi:uncharacterized protein DUF6600